MRTSTRAVSACEDTQPAISITLSQVTILWNTRVRWTTTNATTAMTTRLAIIPGIPVTSPELPSVNQPVALLKKSLPVPIPMIFPSIWMPLRVRFVSNWRRAIEANASVQLSSQPRNGPILGTIRLVNT